MTEVKPATDVELQALIDAHKCCGEGCDFDAEMSHSNLTVRNLIARIESDRAEIARLKAEVERLNLTVCRACSPSVHTSNACLACHGTGRAR